MRSHLKLAGAFVLHVSLLASSTSAVDTVRVASSSSVSVTSSGSAVSTSTSETPTTATASGSKVASSTSTSSSPSASSSAVSQATQETIGIMRQRRIDTFMGSMPDMYVDGVHPNDIDSWLSTLGEDGKWTDSAVDYTAGCDGRRANWPAQRHWQRALVMAAAWNGGYSDADPKFVKDDKLRLAITSAMSYWFKNDYTNVACLDKGGKNECPCDTPGLWNGNWFSNTILIPKLVAKTCLFLSGTLSTEEVNNCTAYNNRAYTAISTRTGANTLEIATVGVDTGLLNANTTMIRDAYDHAHAEVVIRNEVQADGIRGDGSFAQHSGMLYSGNYGKDYSNAAVDLEIAAIDTEYTANSAPQKALDALMDGNQWMIYRDVKNGTLHWDFSTINRFLSFPVADDQVTARLRVNLTQLGLLGDAWESKSLSHFSSSLSASTGGVNAGSTSGNRVFYNTDYMVHRSKGYVTTVKMFSSRTANSECTNDQNPYGLHLSDFTTYTYITGQEYTDIAGAWDWNLIPGTTVDYQATPLSCSDSRIAGKHSFVGGVSNGQVGIAAMRFTNPVNGKLSWNSARFFLDDDVHLIMVANVSSASDSPVYTVLDQKRSSGSIIINGNRVDGTQKIASPVSLWYDNIGYSFPTLNSAFTLSVDVSTKKTNWSAIGTSTQPDTKVNLFHAKLEHNTVGTPLAYLAFPGTDASTFATKNDKTRVQILQNDANLSAAFDPVNEKIMVVFWNETGGTARLSSELPDGDLTITSSGNSAIIYDIKTSQVTASDPSQTLSALKVDVVWGNEDDRSKSFVFQLPSGGAAGSSASQTSSLLFSNLAESRVKYHYVFSLFAFLFSSVCLLL